MKQLIGFIPWYVLILFYLYIQVFNRLSFSSTASITGKYLNARAPNKKIDFCLHIDPCYNKTTEDQITLQTFNRLVDNLEPLSINYTDFEGLLGRPITTSIETKWFGGDLQEAQLQIGVWQMAQWNKLRELVTREGKTTIAVEAALESLSFLPAIMINGHD